MNDKPSDISIIIGILILCVAFYLFPINKVRINIAACKASDNEKIISLQKEILENQKEIRSNFERDIAAMEEVIKCHKEEMKGKAGNEL